MIIFGSLFSVGGTALTALGPSYAEGIGGPELIIAGVLTLRTGIPLLAGGAVLVARARRIRHNSSWSLLKDQLFTFAPSRTPRVVT